MERSLTTPAEVSELTVLYDIYGLLLNKKQQEMFEKYFIENFSLAEVAEDYAITRQGVYDALNRIRKKLREFENNLRIRERTDQIEDRLDLLSGELKESVSEGVIDSNEYDRMNTHIEKIRELL